MLRRRRSLTSTLAAMCVAALALTACGGGTTTTAAAPGTPVGDPVSGGTLQAIQIREPVSLDPVALPNVWTNSGLLGNALYGTLMTNDVDTLEIEYSMATDFSTDDGGRTFVLKLRPGLTFTDGTPLDAAAVAYNWDRLRDPANGSESIRQAAQIAGTEVIDAETLKVTMVAPSPVFASSLVLSGLNWIASPTALAKGRQAFDENPVGAGPFTLTEWARQDVLELTRNPDYWDAPRPYLDGITLRPVPDANQRLNALTSGSADLASESSWSNLSKAESAGLSTSVVPLGGGQYLAMNTRRSPFDDARARRAVSLALDLDAINTAVFEGTGTVPRTLFPENSPFFEDIALSNSDDAEAQRLFDELAADGTPVKFTFLAYSLVEIKTVAEVVQAQLAAFDNVEIAVEIMDFTAAQARVAARDFDMTIAAAVVQDPDSSLWTSFHARSQGNPTGIDDPELNDALDAGRVGTTVEERKAAYDVAQQRLVDLAPGVFYIQSAPSVVSGPDVHGVRMYGMGSAMLDGVWMSE